MIYVTSDIHGYPLKDFKKLLDKAGFGEDDFLYVLGDVIDRNGDGGIEMLLWMMEQPNVELLRGNHEEMLLACSFLFDAITEHSLNDMNDFKMGSLMNWTVNGAQVTIDSLHALSARDSSKLRDLLDYLEEAPLYEMVSAGERDFLLVHAGLGHFYPERKFTQYKVSDLLWHRPRLTERYFDEITTIIGHTPVAYYGAPYNRALHTDTWIDIDVGGSAGNPPMLLRLDDMKEFYADI
jgi:serine/threonine protein phosphatase 1